MLTLKVVAKRQCERLMLKANAERATFSQEFKFTKIWLYLIFKKKTQIKNISKNSKLHLKM